ncbi:MAG: hypothetical protein P8J93_03995 [SAR86 cluster bacterium]|jgi:hypothetical protein|nr:hypothetical protein [SAR86 cluster bacterium]|tara:strand:+ start:91 stop:312 length:222 start_codon:yes stop_codon:yes gene_type:complete
MTSKLVEILFAHIANWRKVWFGLIFWGSIFNAVAPKIGILENQPYLTLVCFGAGFLIGLVAKIRGTWLWHLKT